MNEELKEQYTAMGIAPEVLSYGEEVENMLKSRFAEIDETATTIWAGIRWKRFTPPYSIPRTPWYGPRSPAAPMRWRWR